MNNLDEMLEETNRVHGETLKKLAAELDFRTAIMNLCNALEYQFADFSDSGAVTVPTWSQEDCIRLIEVARKL